ncbi:MAG: FemAB family PEP-CTERM system-associated protein [Blastomonas sp.]
MSAHFRPDMPVARRSAGWTVRLADAGDDGAIDSYVARHPAGTVFHRTGWGRAVEQGTGQARHNLIAEAAGAIVGLLPVQVIHSPLFGRALVSCGFAVDGGIIADDARIADALAERFWEMAVRHSCPTAELRGGTIPTDPQWHVKEETYAGFCGPLVDPGADADERQLLAVPRKQRAEIRKGLQNALNIRIGREAVDLEQHHAVYAESVRNLGTPVFPASLFAAVIAEMGEDADILTVLDGDRPVASVLSLYHGGAVMPYWGGGVFDARRLRANDVMYYALMNHARQRGCTRFDFGRSKVGTGAFAFKKNWGFEPRPLSYAVRTANGAAPRDINPLSPRYRLQVAAWQKLPLAIANRIGPMIARGLG